MCHQIQHPSGLCTSLKRLSEGWHNVKNLERKVDVAERMFAICRQILDAIERNGYNNFTKRAYVPKWRKYLSLPMAFARAANPAVIAEPAKKLLLPASATTAASATGPTDRLAK
jgi:hypothetical protein